MSDFDIEKAITRVFNLGQQYFQQADSDYTSQHKKADGTMQAFRDLRQQIVAEFVFIPRQSVTGKPTEETKP
jgi:hypothetical protein